MKVSCIIVTYNGEKHIRKCLESLEKSKVPMHTIVIDNGSIDGTVQLVREHFPDVSLLELKCNAGFGQANNVGIRMAIDDAADFVFLLNQDTWITENTLHELLTGFEQNDHFGIISPLHMSGSREGYDSLFYSYLSKELRTDLQGEKALKSVYACNFVNAAAWLMPIRTIRLVGGFDPLFFHYGEDRDYVNRLRYRKMEIGICPGSKIWHNRGDSNEFILNYPEAKRNLINYLVYLKDVNNRFFNLWLHFSFYTLIRMVTNRKHLREAVSTFTKVVSRLPAILHARMKSKRITEYMFVNGFLALPSDHLNP